MSNDGTPTDGAPIVEGESLDFDLLRFAIPRLWKANKNAEPTLALEIHQGKYKGVIFAFTKFEVQHTVLENGMAPTKYETEVFQAPEGFVKDAAFDYFTTELLLAWLSHSQQNDYRIIRNVRAREKIQ